MLCCIACVPVDALIVQAAETGSGKTGVGYGRMSCVVDAMRFEVEHRNSGMVVKIWISCHLFQVDQEPGIVMLVYNGD